MQATLSNTLPGPEPGGIAPPGTSSRRGAPTRGTSGPGATHGASARPTRGHAPHDDAFAASLDTAVRDDARRTDDEAEVDPSSDTPGAKGADAPARRTAAQPWWLRAQAERPGATDVDADADGPVAVVVTGITVEDGVAGADETTAESPDTATVTDASAAALDPALAALMAAQTTTPVATPVPTGGAAGDVATASSTPTAAIPSTAVAGEPGAQGTAGAAQGNPSALLAAAGAAHEEDAAAAAGAGVAQVQEQGTEQEPLAAAGTQAAPVTTAHAPASASHAHGVKAGRAYQALERAVAALSGGTIGPSAGGATAGGVGTDARAAARAILAAAADGVTGAGPVAGADVQRPGAGNPATQAAVVDPALVAGVTDTGSPSMDSGARDGRSGAGTGSNEPAVDLGAKVTLPAGGAAPTFVVPTAMNVANPEVTFTLPVSETTAGGEIPSAGENLGRLIQSFRMQTREGLSEATLRLNPAHLGEVTIAIKVDKGVVSATVQAETGSVRQWLQGQEETLRASLADQGLTLEHYAVEPDGQRRQQEPDEDPRAQARRRVRARQGDGPTFEVIA